MLTVRWALFGDADVGRLFLILTLCVCLCVCVFVLIVHAEPSLEPGDQLEVCYSLSGGSFSCLPTLSDDIVEQTLSADDLTGSSLQVS